MRQYQSIDFATINIQWLDTYLTQIGSFHNLSIYRDYFPIADKQSPVRNAIESKQKKIETGKFLMV